MIERHHSGRLYLGMLAFTFLVLPTLIGIAVLSMIGGEIAESFGYDHWAIGIAVGLVSVFALIALLYSLGYVVDWVIQRGETDAE